MTTYFNENQLRISTFMADTLYTRCQDETYQKVIAVERCFIFVTWFWYKQHTC